MNLILKQEILIYAQILSDYYKKDMLSNISELAKEIKIHFNVPVTKDKLVEILYFENPDSISFKVYESL